jgi:hypothetical protein
MVPAALDGTDLMVAAEPVKAVQVEPGCRVDVIGGEGGAGLQLGNIRELQFFLKQALCVSPRNFWDSLGW